MKSTLSRVLFALALALLLPTWAGATISGVDSATDLCSASADPCVISDIAQVVDGTVLDFGTRVVEISGNGRIDAGAGSFALLCGRLRIATGIATGVSLKGTSENGTVGGVAQLSARRRCSGDTSVICLGESDCALHDAGSCTIGSGNVEIAGRIVSNADSPGIVSVDAAGDVTISQQIQLNTTSIDSDGGSLEVDAGGFINVSAKLQANGGAAGTGGDISLIANGDVVATSAIEVIGGDFDGGYLELDAGRDVNLSDSLSASASAGGGFGGEISVNAERDITIVGGASLSRLALDTDGHTSVDNFGGDGGIQDYIAGRDIHLGPFVLATLRGAVPDGYGEEITLDAGRDVLLEADLDVKARGTLGAGGFVTILSGGAVTVPSTCGLDLRGGDGGGETDIEAFRDVTFDGDIDATAGNTAVPGRIDISSATGNVVVSGSMALSGGAFAGNTNLVNFEGCQVRFAIGGSLNNTATGVVNNLTAHDRIFVDSGASVTASAGSNVFTYRLVGKPPVISGVVSPSASLVLDAALSACPVCGNGALEIGETCDDGNVSNGDGCSAGCQDEGCIAQTPNFPTVALCDDGKACTSDSCDGTAHACVHSETCSDGGDCTTDRCGDSGRCLHLPDDSLCVDDVSCTIDTCPFSGRCKHTPDPAPCDDGVDCTTDTCNIVLDCQHSLNNAVCDDQNTCTSDVCDADLGCLYTSVVLPCDDGLACTTGDACTDGVCVGESTCPPDEVCRVSTGDCGQPISSTTTSTSTTSTTSTTTVGPTTTTTIGAVCGNSAVEQGEQCDPGPITWQAGQACRDCQFLMCGDPDGNDKHTAADALFALRAAVHAVTCDCVCDVDGTNSVTASDALRLLRVAVGVSVPMTCPCS